MRGRKGIFVKPANRVVLGPHAEISRSGFASRVDLPKNIVETLAKELAERG